MSKNHCRLLIGAICGLLASSTYADSLAWPDFKTLAKNVPLIARVEIVSKERIVVPRNPSKACGYRMHAVIKELLRGPKIKEVTFFSSNGDDVLEHYSQYLLIGFDLNSSDREAKAQCDHISKYAVGDFEQTLFPISDDPGTGKPQYLMVSRTSPFTTGNFVSTQGGYVETFAIENRRIYALVPWSKVVEEISAVRATSESK